MSVIAQARIVIELAEVWMPNHPRNSQLGRARFIHGPRTGASHAHMTVVSGHASFPAPPIPIAPVAPPELPELRRPHARPAHRPRPAISIYPRGETEINLA